MEHNQYLNEILYLIDKNYSEEKINKEDLNKIELLLSHIKNNNKGLDFNLKKELFKQYIYYKYLSKDEQIDKLIYDNYIQNLRDSLDAKIFGKKFAYSITAFTDFIKDKKDIKIHLIEIEFGNLELAFEIDSKYYTYSDNTLNIINNDNDNSIFKGYVSNFNKNLGKVLDSNLEVLSNSKFKYNTRNILIDYATNFKEIIGYLEDNQIKHLVLECGIVTKRMKYENRFTLMMHFINNDNKILKKIEGKEYYFDTFQLCPPYADGQNHC